MCTLESKEKMVGEDFFVRKVFSRKSSLRGSKEVEKVYVLFVFWRMFFFLSFMLCWRVKVYIIVFFGTWIF